MRYLAAFLGLLILAGCAPHTMPTSRIVSPQDGATIIGGMNLTFVLTDPHAGILNYTIIVDGKPAGHGLAGNDTPRTIPVNLTPGVHKLVVQATSRTGSANSTPFIYNSTPLWAPCLNTVVPSSIIVYQPPSAALVNTKWDTGYTAYELGGGMSCHWGSSMGENVNYLYCSNIGAQYVRLAPNGTILEKRAVEIRLAGQYASRAPGAPTPANSQMRVMSATCRQVPVPDHGSCTDSDGGINYGVRGTLSSGAQDACLPNGQLREFSCGPHGQVEAVLYNCPTTCQDGACVGMP